MHLQVVMVIQVLLHGGGGGGGVSKTYHELQGQFRTDVKLFSLTTKLQKKIFLKNKLIMLKNTWCQ